MISPIRVNFTINWITTLEPMLSLVFTPFVITPPVRIFHHTVLNMLTASRRLMTDETVGSLRGASTLVTTTPILGIYHTLYLMLITKSASLS
jgi:hypothetical protein